MDGGDAGLSGYTKARTTPGFSIIFPQVDISPLYPCRLRSRLTRVPWRSVGREKEVGTPVQLQPWLSWEVFKSGKNGDRLTRYMRFLSPLKTNSFLRSTLDFRYLPAAQWALCVQANGGLASKLSSSSRQHQLQTGVLPALPPPPRQPHQPNKHHVHMDETRDKTT